MIHATPIYGALTLCGHAFLVIVGKRDLGKTSWLVAEKSTTTIAIAITRNQLLNKFCC